MSTSAQANPSKLHTVASGNLQVATFHYRLEIGRERLALFDPRTGHRLFALRSPLLLRPEFHGVGGDWQVLAVEAESVAAGAQRIRVRGELPGVAALTIELACWPEHVEIAAEAQLVGAQRVAHWHLLEPGTHLNLFHAHHWRNRHGHPATFETYNLYQGGKTPEQVAAPTFPPEIRESFTREYDFTTYSSDWQFTPRPTLLLLQRDSVMLGLGARELPQGFGLETHIAAQTLGHLRLNYGGEHGQEIAAGNLARAPRMYLWLDHHGGVWDSVDHYVRLLQEDGEIPRRSRREVPHWWLRPAYCTWNDQGYLSGNAAYYAFPGDTFSGKNPSLSFDAAMLDHLLEILERERYAFGSVIIDDGWQKAWGDWTPHPAKFPDLRRQIDRIHRLGMKVILWHAPFDYRADAELCARTEWLCGGGVRGRHGMPLVDFSNPRVQREYLEPLARSWFSSEPGCLDADGLKLDFMADKIHPVFPVHDPDWRGEERFIHRWQTLTYRLLKQWKPDGQMLGAAAHPHFVSCQDLIRTYDVPVSQRQHGDRAVMLRHLLPGNLVTIDLCETKSLADVEEHWEIAFAHNLLFECGRIAPDPATGRFRVGDEFPALLRRRLAAWATGLEPIPAPDRN